MATKLDVLGDFVQFYSLEGKIPKGRAFLLVPLSLTHLVPHRKITDNEEVQID